MASPTGRTSGWRSCARTAVPSPALGRRRFLLRDLPGRQHHDRAIYWRLLPRADGSWLALWNHGEQDLAWRGLILPDLEHELDHAAVLTAPELARNQEEGGGGFVSDGAAFLSTWQIPSINDPSAVQRLYRVDLARPLDPAGWRIVPGSLGWTDPGDPRQDGGPTADAWNLSLPRPDTLWATAMVWSESQRRNRVLARHCPWPIPVGPWHLGAPDRIWDSHGPQERVVACLEWAVGRSWSADLEIDITRPGAGLVIGLVPAETPPGVSGFGLALGGIGQAMDAVPSLSPPVGRQRLHLERDGQHLRIAGVGQAAAVVELPASLGEDTRLALAVGRGTALIIHHLTLQDPGR